MAVESGPTPLGTPLPDATLPDLEGRAVDLADYAEGHVLLVAFCANHCPYVQWVEPQLAAIAAEFDGLRIVAICSNDADGYALDAPAGLRTRPCEQAGRSRT